MENCILLSIDWDNFMVFCDSCFSPLSAELEYINLDFHDFETVVVKKGPEQIHREFNYSH